MSRALLLLSGLAASLGFQGPASFRAPRAPLPKLHRHPSTDLWTIESEIPEFSIAATSAAAGVRENLAVDRGGRFVAFTIDAVSGSRRVRLLVVERRSGRAREIRGLPFEWRQFSDLFWVDRRTLVFDRWSSPHVGMHYAVDVVGERLVAAVPFHDR